VVISRSWQPCWWLSCYRRSSASLPSASHLQMELRRRQSRPRQQVRWPYFLVERSDRWIIVHIALFAKYQPAVVSKSSSAMRLILNFGQTAREVVGFFVQKSHAFDSNASLNVIVSYIRLLFLLNITFWWNETNAENRLFCSFKNQQWLFEFRSIGILYRVARKNVPNFRMALCNRVGEMNPQKSM